MLKYKVFDKIGGQYLISLDSDDPNAIALILIDVGQGGDRHFLPVLADWLNKSYGALGHFLGKSTTPIDLDAAMHSDQAKEFHPEIIEGQDLVKSYDPGIPEEAIT